MQLKESEEKMQKNCNLWLKITIIKNKLFSHKMILINNTWTSLGPGVILNIFFCHKVIFLPAWNKLPCIPTKLSLGEGPP